MVVLVVVLVILLNVQMLFWLLLLFGLIVSVYFVGLVVVADAVWCSCLYYTVTVF